MAMHRIALWLGLSLAMCGVCNGFAATPRSGWVLVPGAEDLIQTGSWSCNPGVAAGTNSFTASAGSGYNTIVNTYGPMLKTTGDFSVLATFSASSSAGAFLTLVGTLNTGSDWWNGLKRLDVGYGSNTIFANYWTGSSSNATTQSTQTAAAANTPISLEVARIGKQIVVFVNGAQAGSFADPGLFASGQVYLGVNVAPQNSMTVLSLAASVPAGSNAGVFAPYLQVATRGGTALRDLAEPAGFLIGAAVAPADFTDPGYVQAVGREFNLVVPENAMKFAETEPAAHSFNFCAADQIVAYSQANGMKIRGHNLVWQQDLPSWLTGGNYSPADAAAILKEHIDTVAGHYKGKLIEWDVVNEAIAYGAPYGPQPSYWLDQLGSGYIDQAFQWAHAADPNVKLYYNDTGGDGRARPDACLGSQPGRRRGHLSERVFGLPGQLQLHGCVDLGSVGHLLVDPQSVSGIRRRAPAGHAVSAQACLRGGGGRVEVHERHAAPTHWNRRRSDSRRYGSRGLARIAGGHLRKRHGAGSRNHPRTSAAHLACQTAEIGRASCRTRV